ncbi:MAG TPA: hypothetical protein VK766_08825 [Cytophagaceae bacterium]|jgi:hypothetical protein|nr:hypothetical protein [Cytophagaceae bacterium]
MDYNLLENKFLNIIAYDVPFPPNYGGVIDIYYKVKALASLGIRINLHCFVNRNKAYSDELYDICENVYYYKRENGFSYFSSLPHIVNSRRSENLIFNLLQNDHPILFEGIHTCYYLSAPELKNRKKMVRIQDVEPEYYYNLYKNASGLFHKQYFYMESIRLRKYEKILHYADTLITLNIKDQEYYKKLFPEKEIINLAPFSAHSTVDIKEGMGSYALFHSNLTEADNKSAAIFLLKEVVKDTKVPFIIAGKDPDSELKHLCKERKVKILANPSDEKLDELIRNAQVNILVSFMPCGSKIKIYPALYHGRHCLVNSNMVRGSSFADVCHVSDSEDVLRNDLLQLMQQPFTKEEIQRREEVFGEISSEKKAEILSRLF